MAKSVTPIRAAPDSAGTTSAVLTLFRQLHEQLREAISGVEGGALNWVPTAGANSVATIITHVVGSEAETLCSLAGLPCERDRDAEFCVGEVTPGQILGLLEEADDLIAEVGPQIGAERLKSKFSLPTMLADEARSGVAWLVGTMATLESIWGMFSSRGSSTNPEGSSVLDRVRERLNRLRPFIGDLACIGFRAPAVVQQQLQENQVMPATEFGTHLGHPSNLSKPKVLMELD